MDIALFSPSSLFAEDEDISIDEKASDVQQSFVERRHQFPGMELLIREFSFHQLNANLLWPDSWGDTFPTAEPDWDLIIASDILLYVKQYPNLIKSLSFLLKSYKPKDDKAIPVGNDQSSGMCMGLPAPAFLMSWRRRIGKEDESLFFTGCENAGLQVEHIGSRMYCIKTKKVVTTTECVDD